MSEYDVPLAEIGRIASLPGYSAHADEPDLVRWFLGRTAQGEGRPLARTVFLAMVRQARGVPSPARSESAVAATKPSWTSSCRPKATTGSA
ncbi:MAG: hypothetical protein R3F60_33355 [bacterium]